MTNDTKAPTLVEALTEFCAYAKQMMAEHGGDCTGSAIAKATLKLHLIAGRASKALAAHEAAEGAGEADLDRIAHVAANAYAGGEVGWDLFIDEQREEWRECVRAVLAATPSRARQAEGREEAAEHAVVLGKARRLAASLWRTHYAADAPDWKPLPDLRGVISQIDNLTTGLVRATPAPPSVTLELSERERHELECLRARVQQIEYPCSPHCDGYLRELALRNTTPLASGSARLDQVEIARIIWNRFAPSHALEFPGAVDEWGSVADAIIALARSARGEG